MVQILYFHARFRGAYSKWVDTYVVGNNSADHCTLLLFQVAIIGIKFGLKPMLKHRRAWRIVQAWSCDNTNRQVIQVERVTTGTFEKVVSMSSYLRWSKFHPISLPIFLLGAPSDRRMPPGRQWSFFQSTPGTTHRFRHPYHLRTKSKTTEVQNDNSQRQTPPTPLVKKVNSIKQEKKNSWK